MKLTIEEAKERLRIPELARRLGITAEIPERDGKTVRCWWPDLHPNGDRTPSFNLHNELTRFHCFACGMDGDGPDLVCKVCNVGRKEGIRMFLEMAGGTSPSPIPRQIGMKAKRELVLPGDLSTGSSEAHRQLAESRAIHPTAVNLAVTFGLLRFGTVHGISSWLILDESRRIAEARTLDRSLFPAIGKLSERKVHTLRGSRKDWPVGIQPAAQFPKGTETILLVEGGPDLLAAIHFLHVIERRILALPVAMLGRENRRISPEALSHFRGKRVRIFPHIDPDGGGIEAAKRWKTELREAGAGKIDAFNLSGLIRRDGKPVTDLNDCTVIRDEDKPQLERLLP